MKRCTHCVRIGTGHSYESVWDFQRQLQQGAVQAKRHDAAFRPNYLLLCEHPPVYTMGKSGDMAHLKSDIPDGITPPPAFFKINRGGDITFHGPGQVTAYPIFDLDQFYRDLHRYVRDLEEVVIMTLAEFGLQGDRIPGLTGVWLGKDEPCQRKICAIGIHMSRWVSMHGLALNVNTDLTYFDGIIPCGINDPDKSVTSFRAELGREVAMTDVEHCLKTSFAKVFGLTYI